MARRINLDEESEAILAAALKSGRYQTPDDVLRAAIDLLRKREAAVTRFEAEIQKGIDAADRGELVDAEEVFDRLERKYADLAEQRRRRA